MNKEILAIDDQDLVDYADGQLDPSRLHVVEELIASNPEAAAKVSAYRGQRQQLHDMFDPILSAPIPKHLIPQEDFSSPSNAKKPRFFSGNMGWRLAAMVAWFGLGIGMGWMIHQNGPTLQASVTRPAHILFQQASIAHAVYAPEILHPVEVSGKDEKKLARWLSERLGIEIKIPNFDRHGFTLIGGRLLPARPGNIAAQLMYENKNKLRLTLYIRPMEKKDPNTAIRYEVTKGIGVTYWIDRDWGYALSGRFDEAEMLKLSETVYKQSRL